ncbi:MAG: PhzF family phenazine biosynthesis protein [Thermodesulfobacteriota bacterium]
MSYTVDIFQVDSFTGDSFKGNPAAVCILDSPKEVSWMQSVAREMNLSETAFVLSPGERDKGYSLRWFTPTVEVSLCGHATLASAHILWEEGIIKPDEEVVFHTLSGALRVWREASIIWMDFPADTLSSVDIPDGFLKALGLSALEARAFKLFKGRSDYLLHLDFTDGEDILSSLSPDFDLLRLIPSRGVIVTAASRIEGFDFASRFFAPAFGIDEDPVTGSAHSALGPYWAGLLQKRELRAYQASARGGVVRLCVKPDQEDGGRGGHGTRLDIGGMAVTVSKGKLDI